MHQRRCTEERNIHAEKKMRLDPYNEYIYGILNESLKDSENTESDDDKCEKILMSLEHMISEMVKVQIELTKEVHNVNESIHDLQSCFGTCEKDIDEDDETSCPRNVQEALVDISESLDSISESLNTIDCKTP